MAVNELDKNSKLYQGIKFGYIKHCLARLIITSEWSSFLDDSILSKTETLNET